MEVLGVLEKKIAGLIDLIKDLRTQNSALSSQKDLLAQENAQLNLQVEQLQALLLERPQELALTKLIVDDLIKNIDTLIEHEQS